MASAACPFAFGPRVGPGSCVTSATSLNMATSCANLRPLGGGAYVVDPEGLEAQATIQIDGSRIVWVVFLSATPVAGIAGSAATPKTAAHVLLVGAMPADRASYLVLLRYIARFQPTIAATVAEAAAGEHVTIIGSELTVSSAAEATLAGAGATVERILPANIESELGRRLNEVME